MLIDTHCHLDDPVYAGDLDAVLERAEAAGVRHVVTIGTDVSSSRRAVKLASRRPGISAVVGIHPNESTQWTDEATVALEQLAREPSVVAIGEVGLDYYRDHAPREVQQEAFRRALALARKTRQAIVIHCREAWDDLFGILREQGSPPIGGILHCFSGGPAQRTTALDLGFTISFAGNVTFKNAEPLRDIARQVPLDRMVLETDAPYLTPHPHRGHRNEPAYVALTAQQVAVLKGVSVEDVGRVTSQTARAVFRLPDPA